MFGAMGQAAARARYRDVDLGSKVEGASPHGLIAILFDELGRTLDTIAASLSRPAPVGAAGPVRVGLPERRARATSILCALEGSLDHAAGGTIARDLAAIYREARRLTEAGVAAGDPAPVLEARAMVGEIAGAWAAIG
jgi:flagellar secretion chaperone FliS